MSGAAETSLWNWLSKARRIFRDQLDINRVENSLMKGMPDVEGCLARRQFWIELKSTARPKRGSTKIQFAVKDREQQVEWLKRRWDMARNAWLLCQVGQGHQACRYLIPGQFASVVYAGVVEEMLREMSVIDPRADQKTILNKSVHRGNK